MDPTTFEMLVERKRALLNDFIKKVGSNGIRQNTPEWVEIKKRFIGGSEIASALGKNPYQNIKAFVQKKLGISSPFVETMAMRWGKLFEPVGRRFTEIKFSTTILGDDLFFYMEDKECAYSPDGLGVFLFPRKIDANNSNYPPEIMELIEAEIKGDLDGNARKSTEDGTVIKRMINIVIPQIVLIELKFPMVRTLTNKVPEYYLPQPKTGLCMIDCTEHGLFIELVARPCLLSDLGFGPEYARGLEVPDNQSFTCYDPEFKTAIIGAKDPKNVHTAATGLLVFMGPADSPHLNKLQELALEYVEILTTDDILDLSDCSARMFGLYLEEWKKGGMGMIVDGNESSATGQTSDLFVWYSEVYTEKSGFPGHNKIWAAAEEQAKISGYKIIGYLGYKIIDHRIHDIEKEPDYLTKNAAQITEVTSFIKKVNERIKEIEVEKTRAANGELTKAELQRRAVQNFMKKEENIETMIEKFSNDFMKKYGQAQGYHK